MIAATIRQAQLKIKTGVVIGRLTVEMTWVLMMAPLLAVLFDEARPVPVRLAQVVLLVFVEIVLDSQVVLHQQASVNDLPRFDLDGGLVSLARAIGAVAAELRLVLRRLFVKGGFVFRGNEVVLCPTIFRLELRVALDRPIVGKKSNRVVALDGNSVVIQILEFFGRCHRRQRHKQQESRKQTLHLQIPSFFRFLKTAHSHQTRQGDRSDTNKKGGITVTFPVTAHRMGNGVVLKLVDLPSRHLAAFAAGRVTGRIIMNATGLRTLAASSPVARCDNDHNAETSGLIEAQGSYRVRLASSEADRLAAFRLRFLVFNLELDEGLDAAHATGYDTDHFDAVCDHLVVEHPGSGKVVGTYRLQTGVVASANVGYYSEREFDFTPYKRLGDSVIELGRACVHRDHRSSEVLYLLWRGIAQYAIHNGGRYLIGCSSLTSQDPAHGTAVYKAMREHLVEPQLRTSPQAAFAMPLKATVNASDKIPKLLRAYLAVGAKICGPPAIDREFKTIDFLTLMDLEALHPRVRARFLKA